MLRRAGDDWPGGDAAVGEEDEEPNTPGPCPCVGGGDEGGLVGMGDPIVDPERPNLDMK